MRKKPNHQATYRRAQTQKGLIRFELQVSAHTKARFDQMVHALAADLPSPWDPRRRLAQARAQLFDTLTQHALPTFNALNQQLHALKAEVQALAPPFFKKTTTHNAQPVELPNAIAALPDDPHALKQQLAHLYTAHQKILRHATEQERRAKQYLALYEASQAYNDR